MPDRTIFSLRNRVRDTQQPPVVRRHRVEMAIQSTILRSLALRMALAALAVLLIEVVYPAAIAAQSGL